MKVRSVHPHVWHTTGKIVFQPSSRGDFEAEVDDEVGQDLIRTAPSDFHVVPEDLHGEALATESSEVPEVPVVPEEVEEELVDDPADEHVSERHPASARKGRRGGSRTV